MYSSQVARLPTKHRDGWLNVKQGNVPISIQYDSPGARVGRENINFLTKVVLSILPRSLTRERVSSLKLCRPRLLSDYWMGFSTI